MERTKVEMPLVFLVPARDEFGVTEKISQINKLGHKYVIVCGARLDLPGVFFREPLGKFDAINFGMNLVGDADVVCLNDVDTRIVDFEGIFREFNQSDSDLLFSRVNVSRGPQIAFYRILDLIRSRVLIASSGELMLIKADLLQRICPIPPCQAEDSYILYKAMEFRRRVGISAGTHIETSRTNTFWEEMAYKRRTTLGVYQALSMAKPRLAVRLFYRLLPFFAWTLIFRGPIGAAWAMGIYAGIWRFLKGDRTGAF